MCMGGVSVVTSRMEGGAVYGTSVPCMGGVSVVTSRMEGGGPRQIMMRNLRVGIWGQFRHIWNQFRHGASGVWSQVRRIVQMVIRNLRGSFLRGS